MQITAYNVKTKEKNVPMLDAVITKTARGGYMAQGNDGKGNKLTSLLSEAKAWRLLQPVLQRKDGINSIVSSINRDVVPLCRTTSLFKMGFIYKGNLLAIPLVTSCMATSTG